MKLQGMTDQQFETILTEVTEIQFLIVQAGKMATKSLVEKVLMKRYQLDHGDARTFTNITESRNIRNFNLNPLIWTAKKQLAPSLEKYPELSEVLNGR